MKARKIVAVAVLAMFLVFVMLLLAVDRFVLSPSAPTSTAAPAPRT